MLFVKSSCEFKRYPLTYNVIWYNECGAAGKNVNMKECALNGVIQSYHYFYLPAVAILCNVLISLILNQ